jgi:chromosome segregation protein
MYLKRLEIQGFKTFAQKTVLEFHLDPSGKRGVTAIVGPNGSGKSNAADAIRWAMGEQSLKLLRGKKSEDVIFSGSETKSRSGFAEVTITLESDGPEDQHPDLDIPTVEITRRLYREGQSEYEVNRKPVKLADVVLLLAQCGVGQRSYSVIGQGMIDSVLVANPMERKEFFDEAFGLRPFQLKRQKALNKIDDSKKNIAQTNSLLREIEPRLRTLERQAKRLEQKDEFEAELKTLSRDYYGFAWKKLMEGMSAIDAEVKKIEAKRAGADEGFKKLEEELKKIETQTETKGFAELRKKLDVLSGDRSALERKKLALEKDAAIAEVKASQDWAPLPLSKIITSVGDIRKKHEALMKLLETESPDLKKIKALVKELHEMSADFSKALERPAPETKREEKMDASSAELDKIDEQINDVEEKMKAVQKEMDQWSKGEEEERKRIFRLQHEMNQKRSAAAGVEQELSKYAVEKARVETRRDTLIEEIKRFHPELEKELDALAKSAKDPGGDAAVRLQKLRSQLEWIGGIDPETLKDYNETKERYDFLSKQLDDVEEALRGLETVVAELDKTIEERSAQAFRKLDKEFSKYFEKLFGGGTSKLQEVRAEPEIDEEGNELPVDDRVTGIEIQATPPGKRNKSIALLSGGERALTSIALICAIIATNPSPFVVLDEVDAALDESNSRKFASIIASLADRTQFVLVTHNRATMEEAHTLYGVTMGDDGVSQLLSVKFEDVEKLKRG